MAGTMVQAARPRQACRRKVTIHGLLPRAAGPVVLQHVAVDEAGAGELGAGDGPLPALERAVVRDQQILDQEEAKRAPYEPENDRLESILDDAVSDLRSAQNRLSGIRNDLSETSSRLRQAESELSNLRSRLSYLERDVRDAEAELRNARYERDRFDADGEIRRRTESSSTVRRLREEAVAARNEVRNWTRQTEAARANLQQAQQNLRQCQATAGADCSAQQAAVNQAQSEFNNANSQLQAAERRVDDVDRRLNREIADISRDVRNEEARLNRRVDDAVDKLNRAQRDYDQAVIRIQNLENNVIPDLRRDIRDLERDEADAESDVRRASSVVDAAEAELERYRRSVGWDQLTARIRAAAQNLARSTDARDDALSTKAEQERIIARTNQRQRELEQTLAARLQELEQLKTRESQLIETITKYRNERAPFDREAQRLLDIVNGNRATYKAIIEA